jgi:hypothetical protein
MPHGFSPLKEAEVVKVLLERTIKGKHVGEITRLLRQMRVLALQQPDTYSGKPSMP